MTATHSDIPRWLKGGGKEGKKEKQGERGGEKRRGRKLKAIPFIMSMTLMLTFITAGSH